MCPLFSSKVFIGQNAPSLLVLYLRRSACASQDLRSAWAHVHQGCRHGPPWGQISTFVHLHIPVGRGAVLLKNFHFWLTGDFQYQKVVFLAALCKKKKKKNFRYWKSTFRYWKVDCAKVQSQTSRKSTIFAKNSQKSDFLVLKVYWFKDFILFDLKSSFSFFEKKSDFLVLKIDFLVLKVD